MTLAEALGTVTHWRWASEFNRSSGCLDWLSLFSTVLVTRRGTSSIGDSTMYAVRFETDVLHEAQLLAFDRITRVLIAVASSNTEEVTCEVCRNHISEVTSKHLLESE